MPLAAPASSHLLLPLFASLLFVVGALFGKAAAVRGASPYTNTVAANVCLGLIWAVFGLWRHAFLPVSAWGPAVGVACLFVLGQLLTYLAFQHGDVSLATPIFGVKIILVALLSSLIADQPVPLRIWIAAVLASIGVAVVQMSPRRPGQSPLSARQATLSVLLALLAAASYSLFDVGLQFSGASLGAEPFLSTMFILVGLLSCLLLPWTDSLARLKSLQAVRPVALTAILIAGQAVLICYALGRFGDATRVNIVYALRGLWSVLLAWLLDRLAASPEGRHAPRVLLYRLLGAAILLACVILAML